MVVTVGQLQQASNAGHLAGHLAGKARESLAVEIRQTERHTDMLAYLICAALTFALVAGLITVSAVRGIY